MPDTDIHLQTLAYSQQGVEITLVLFGKLPELQVASEELLRLIRDQHSKALL